MRSTILRRLSLLSLLAAAPALRSATIYEQIDAASDRGAYADAVALADAHLAQNPRAGHVFVRRGIAHSSAGQLQESALDYAQAYTLLTLGDDTARNRAIVLTNLADVLRRAGEPTAAIAAAFAAKFADATYARAFTGIAEAWYDLGSLADAQSFLAQAQKLDANLQRTFTAEEAARRGAGRTRPDDKANTSADFDAAIAAYNSQEYTKALELYDRIVALRPLNSGAWGNRGNTLFALRRYNEAVISQTIAAALDSTQNRNTNTARHLGNRTNAWLQLDAIEAALADTELATRLAPDFAYAWARRAAACFAAGDASGADTALAKAHALDASIAEKTHDPATAATNLLRRKARTGDRAALAELVDRAVEHHPELFEGNPARETAIAVLDRLLERTPRDAALLVLRARAENAPEVTSRLLPAEGSFAFLDRAIAADPKCAEAYALRGVFRLESLPESEGEKAAAYADLDRAIALGTKNTEAFSHRAAHRSEAKDFRGAVADLTTALALDPNNRNLLRARIRDLCELREWDAALEDNSRLIALGETGSFGLRAETYLKAGRLEEALADFDQAVEHEPKNSDHYLGRAHTHRRLGHRDAALADHRKARELDPLLPELAADLANAEAVEALRNDVDHAIARTAAAFRKVNDAAAGLMQAELEKARAEARLRRLFTGEDRSPDEILEEVAAHEKSGIADAEDHRDRARALVKLQRVDEALAALDRSLQLDDQAAEVFDLRGRIRESRKEYDLAFADYDRAVALEPKNADYLRDRGDIWWEREQFEHALADYEAALASDATDATNWFKRGNARLALGRYDDAIADYDEALKLDPELASAAKNRALAARRKAGS